MRTIDFIDHMGFWKNRADGRKLLASVIIVGAFILASLGLASTVGAAKGVYPAGDITLICYSEAGGGWDNLARGISPYLAKYWKEVSPGAKGGVINVKFVTAGKGIRAYATINEAEPDGYTIGWVNPGHIYDYMSGEMKLTCDPRKFTFLFATADTTRVLVTPKKGLATWEEMMAASKKAPLRMVVGTYGSAAHYSSFHMKETVGISATILPVGSTPNIFGALLRGDVDMSSIPYENAKPLIEAKELNVLVSFSQKRILPNVPTIAEKGFPKDLSQELTIRPIVAPPNMDPEVKRIIIATAQKAIADPGYQEFLKTLGIVEFIPIYDNALYEKVMSDVNLFIGIAKRLR